MSAPTVSVIVPVYHSERYLLQSLESVAAQSFKDFEIIVVDDGSRDRQAEGIVNGFNSAHGLHAHYFYKSNGGPSSARNFGLRHARGKYIAFLDADDYYSAEKLSCQTELLDSLTDNYACVVGAARKFTDDAKRGQIVKPSLVDGALDIEAFLCGEQKIEGTPAYLFRRDALAAVEGYDEDLRNNEDFDLLVRLGERFFIKTHDDVVFHRRMRTDSLSKGNPLNGLTHSLRFIDKCEQRLAGVPAAVFARRRQRAYFNAAFLCLKRGRIGEYVWLVRQGAETGGGVSTWRGRAAVWLAALIPVRAKSPGTVEELRT